MRLSADQTARLDQELAGLNTDLDRAVAHMARLLALPNPELAIVELINTINHYMQNDQAARESIAIGYILAIARLAKQR